MLHVMRGCLPDLELCLFGHYLWWQMKGFDFAKIMILVGNRESDLYCNVVDHLIGRAIMCLFSTVFFFRKKSFNPSFYRKPKSQRKTFQNSVVTWFSET
jgi:hypothetical protein